MNFKTPWLGNFAGSNLGFYNYEILTIQHINHTDRKMEPALMRTKWFDYRRLHPMQATYYFVKCYQNAYRDFWRRALDNDRAQYVRAIKAHDFLESKEKNAIWRLRQRCDQCSLPYDFFLRVAMTRHFRIVAGGKIYAPRPNVFLNDEVFAEALLEWEEQCEATLQVSCDPYYRVGNFIGSENQLAHEAWVVRQVKKRGVTRYALATAIYHYDAVRIEEAIRQFDPMVVADAVGIGS